MSRQVPEEGAVKGKGGKGQHKERCMQAGRVHEHAGAKQAEHAKRVKGRARLKGRGRESKKEKERERLSALGSQDTLVTARQVSPGIDASAILTKHQREA